MKTIRFYDIQFLFENDAKYQRQYIIEHSESPQDHQSTYDKEIEYLDSIREVVIEVPNDYDMDLLMDYLIDETGEYIEDFKYEVLP